MLTLSVLLLGTAGVQCLLNKTFGFAQSNRHTWIHNFQGSTCNNKSLFTITISLVLFHLFYFDNLKKGFYNMFFR